MKSSDAAFSLIKKFEGLRLTAYVCSAGKLTIGYGSTCNVYPGMVITMEEASGRLLSDLAEADEIVNRLVKVPLSQNQFDALASFVFNFGETKFSDSTLLKLINERDPKASEQFLRWVYERNPITMNMNKNRGLVKRRQYEKSLFDSESSLT